MIHKILKTDMEVIRDSEVTRLPGEDQVETDGSGYVKEGEACVTNLRAFLRQVISGQNL